ncbi:10640_t:CDS:2, partial [Dentiscutata erythropus]
MTSRIIKPTRIYFTTFPRNIRTPQEALILYSVFKEKGPLIEFKFARDLESKRMLRFGWVSYKDEKVSEKLLADEIHTLPEPLDFDIKVQKSTEAPGAHRMYSERFKGFYTQNDSEAQSSKIDPEVHSAEIDPEVHSVKIDPEVHSAKIDPEVHGVKIDPEVHSAKIDSEVHGIKIDPEVHGIKIDPEVHSVKIDPEVHSAKIDPEVHSVKINPE